MDSEENELPGLQSVTLVLVLLPLASKNLIGPVSLIDLSL